MRVKRAGVGRTVAELQRRHRRNCASAPATPGSVALTFHKREEHHRKEWTARVDWDAVTLDVAGRPLQAHDYEVVLSATDASGEAVETRGQETALTADGSSFSNAAGSTTVSRNAIVLNAVGARVKRALTGLTVGIEAQVKFLARKDAADSDPHTKWYVYDVTASADVEHKTAAPDSVKRPKLVAAVNFTPLDGHSYEARAELLSGGSGKAVLDHVKWHDLGSAAVWRKRIAGNAPGSHANFHVSNPGTWFYTAEVRALNHTHHHKCWGAYGGPTTPKRADDGDLAGPPAPTGLVLSFDHVGGTRKNPWRLKAVWNETPWWLPPDGEPVGGARGYDVYAEMSNDGGDTVAKHWKHHVNARDADDDQTARYTTHEHVQGRRAYRFRVRAIDSTGRVGAFSDFTTWASPHGVPDPVTGLVLTNPAPGLLLATWDAPADLTDADRFHVRVEREDGPAVVVDEGDTTSAQWSYHVPEEGFGVEHTVYVDATEDELLGDVDPDEDVGPASPDWGAAPPADDPPSASGTPTLLWGTLALEDGGVTPAKLSSSVRAAGAVSDGATDDSAAAQSVIDAMAALGGGEVVFEGAAFPYRVEGLTAADGVTVRLLEGAVLKPFASSVFVGTNVSGFHVIGDGEFDMNGLAVRAVELISSSTGGVRCCSIGVTAEDGTTAPFYVHSDVAGTHPLEVDFSGAAVHGTRGAGSYAVHVVKGSRITGVGVDVDDNDGYGVVDDGSVYSYWRGHGHRTGRSSLIIEGQQSVGGYYNEKFDVEWWADEPGRCQVLEFNDIGTGDTFKLAVGGETTAASITYSADMSVAIAAALNGLTVLASNQVRVVKRAPYYDVFFDDGYPFTVDVHAEISITNAVGFSPTGVVSIGWGVNVAYNGRRGRARCYSTNPYNGAVTVDVNIAGASNRLYETDVEVGGRCYDPISRTDGFAMTGVRYGRFRGIDASGCWNAVFVKGRDVTISDYEIRDSVNEDVSFAGDDTMTAEDGTTVIGAGYHTIIGHPVAWNTGWSEAATLTWLTLDAAGKVESELGAQTRVDAHQANVHAHWLQETVLTDAGTAVQTPLATADTGQAYGLSAAGNIDKTAGGIKPHADPASDRYALANVGASDVVFTATLNLSSGAASVGLAFSGLATPTTDFLFARLRNQGGVNNIRFGKSVSGVDTALLDVDVTAALGGSFPIKVVRGGPRVQVFLDVGAGFPSAAQVDYTLSDSDAAYFETANYAGYFWTSTDDGASTITAVTITGPNPDVPASQVGVTPVGTVAATDVQSAIQELDSEKSATGHGAADHADVTRWVSVQMKSGVITADGATLAASGTAPDILSRAQLANAATQGLYFGVHLPSDAKAANPVTVIIEWVTSATESGTSVQWSVDVLAVNSGVVPTAAGTTTAWTGSSAAKTSTQIVVEAAVQVLASASAGDFLRVDVRRLGSDGADSFTGTASVVGVRLCYTATQ